MWEPVVFERGPALHGQPQNTDPGQAFQLLQQSPRAGLTPDWMPGAIPRCVPVETRRNQHGERSITIVVGTEQVFSRGRWRTVDVLSCPVTWSPHPDHIAAARRAYAEWWHALGWIREGLASCGLLRTFEVTDAMPRVEPWR